MGSARVVVGIWQRVVVGIWLRGAGAMRLFPNLGSRMSYVSQTKSYHKDMSTAIRR